MLRGKLAAACLTLVAALAAGCGSSGPSPTPVDPPPPPPPPNNPPIVRSIDAEHTRLEVKGTTTLTAVVEDPETAQDRLRYEWTTDAGTITGEGPQVTFAAPESIEEPGEPEITLTVVESYTVNGSERTNRTEFKAGPVRVHDSRAELTRLARTFLDDFMDSSVSAEESVRNFSDTCEGKGRELRDVQFNRATYNMLPQSNYTIRSVNIVRPWDWAEIRATCEFHAEVIRTHELIVAPGTCRLTAKYETDRWWLCDSSFGGPGGVSTFVF